MNNNASVLTVVFAFAALHNAHAAEPPTTFTFHFAPPDGTSVSQEYRLVRERSIGEQTPQRDEAVAKSSGVFRKEGGLYLYSTKTDANVLRRNGQPINDPVSALLANTTITYVISPDGEAQEIQGFADVETAARKSLPPAIAASLTPVLSEASLVTREKAEWNSRYSDFANGTFSIGDIIDVKVPYQLPNGTAIEYVIRTSFPRWEACPAGSCVRIEMIYESDAAALQSLVKDVVANVSSAAGVALPKQSFQPVLSSRITGSASRLIDPKTMLIYAEQVSRTISMPVDIPGQGRVPTIQREERTYKYTYQ